MKYTLLAALTALALGIGACDDDDEKGNTGGRDGAAGGAGGLNIGVAKNKPVNELTPAERQQACNDLQAWVTKSTERMAPKVCKVVGALTALEQSPSGTCEQTVSACEADANADAGAGPEATSMCSAVQPNCTATVGEVETCTNDQTAVLDSYLGLWPSCAQIAAGTGTLPLGLPQDAPSCVAIQSKCPDLPLFSSLLQEALAGRRP